MFLFDHTPMPLFRMVSRIIPPFSAGSVIISLAMVFIQAIVISRMVERYQLITPLSYLPAFFFLLISSAAVSLHRINPALLANFFLLAAVNRMLSTYKKDEWSLRFFESSFLIGAGSLFYSGTGWMIVLPLIALALMRPFNWREYFYVPAGFVTAYILAGSYHYLVMNDLSAFVRNISACYFTPSLRWEYVTVSLKWFIIFITVLGFVATVFIIFRLQIEKVQTRISMYILIWTGVLLLLIFFFSPSAQLEILQLVAFPAGIILAYYFKDFKPRFVAEVLFLFLFGIMASIRLWL